MVAPWHIYESVTHPEFVWFYFIDQHVLRFLGKMIPHDFMTGHFYATSP